MTTLVERQRQQQEIQDEQRAKRVREEELAEEAGKREERAWVNGLTRQFRDVRQVERGREAAQGAERRHGR